MPPFIHDAVPSIQCLNVIISELFAASMGRMLSAQISAEKTCNQTQELGVLADAGSAFCWRLNLRLEASDSLVSPGPWSLNI